MNTSNSIKRVAIIGYSRTPFSKANTYLKDHSADELLTTTLQSLSSKYKLKDKILGEVVGGAVIKHSNQGNLVRESLLKTDIHPLTPAFDIQKACATSVEAAIIIANKIALGQIENGIACGVDSASDSPIVSNELFRKAFLNQQLSLSDYTKENANNWKLMLPEIPNNNEPETGLSMGEHAEIMAKYYHINREEQDNFAYESHKKLARAYQSGFIADMIIPMEHIQEDSILRKNPSLDKMKSLNPAFDLTSGSLTAANSTPFSDGAAGIFLASEEWAKENNYPILAFLSFAATAGIEYINNRQNLLLAPVLAIQKVLKQSNRDLDSFSFIEIHEAFAAQALTTVKILNNKGADDSFWSKYNLDSIKGSVDSSKLNVVGSSLATGHPFAATGARIIATLAKLLSQEGKGSGLISICAARGNGVALILDK